jgi:hypothetical protein
MVSKGEYFYFYHMPLGFVPLTYFFVPEEDEFLASQKQF